MFICKIVSVRKGGVLRAQKKAINKRKQAEISVKEK